MTGGGSLWNPTRLCEQRSSRPSERRSELNQKQGLRLPVTLPRQPVHRPRALERERGRTFTAPGPQPETRADSLSSPPQGTHGPQPPASHASFWLYAQSRSLFNKDSQVPVVPKMCTDGDTAQSCSEEMGRGHGRLRGPAASPASLRTAPGCPGQDCPVWRLSKFLPVSPRLPERQAWRQSVCGHR